MIRDMLKGDIVDPKWQEHLGDFMSVQSRKYLSFGRLPHQHVVDAKSLYDMLSKEVAGGRADRRTAIDLSILRDVFSRTGWRARWVPHH